jgi:hypothetical protein
MPLPPPSGTIHSWKHASGALVAEAKEDGVRRWEEGHAERRQARLEIGCGATCSSTLIPRMSFLSTARRMSPSLTPFFGAKLPGTNPDTIILLFLMMNSMPEKQSAAHYGCPRQQRTGVHKSKTQSALTVTMRSHPTCIVVAVGNKLCFRWHL